MVPALNPTGPDSPRTGVPAYLRGEILTPLPGDVPSLCDPLTGARRGGETLRAARCARIETCADRITGAGVAMYRLPSPGPVCPDAKPAPDRASPHLRRLSRTLL